jgi:hypothetical protein
VGADVDHLGDRKALPHVGYAVFHLVMGHFDEAKIITVLKPFDNGDHGSATLVIVVNDHLVPGHPAHLGIQLLSLIFLQAVGHIGGKGDIKLFVFKRQLLKDAGLNKIDIFALTLPFCDIEHFYRGIDPGYRQTFSIQPAFPECVTW